MRALIAALKALCTNVVKIGLVILEFKKGVCGIFAATGPQFDDRRSLPRDAMLNAVYAVVVCLSVCLCVYVCVCVSVTLRYCIKTAKRRIRQITPHDTPGL